MRLIPLIKMKFGEFESAVKSVLSKKLTEKGTRYGSSTVFGQLLSVLGSTTENTMSYIEDALTEQNKYTAQRKRSIYSMATLSGYIPSLGHAATANLQLAFKPSVYTELNLVIKNHTRVTCLQNGMQFNIVLPQENIIMNLDRDGSVKQLYAVEGKFETQKFTSKGGPLYSQLVRTSGDTDPNYLSVKINGDTWTQVDSIYDMNPDGHEYIVRPSQVKGFVVTFGNDAHGRALSEGDQIEVTYLLHNGEQGNIEPNAECLWSFSEQLYDISGEPKDGNELINIVCDNIQGITSGTYAEATEQVRASIGTNSRSLVLADPRNYKNLISHFSFCGYSRTWSEEGSLIINSIIMRNYKELMQQGKDYFNLTESDFLLTPTQKASVINTVEHSGQQLAGAVYNVFDPEMCKYACYVYLKMKNVPYNESYVNDQVRDLIGNFFADVKSDLFIPKSDIVHLLKSKIDAIDSVDVYFMSARNEQAIIDGYYENHTYKYDPVTGHYKILVERVTVEPGEDPGVGLDEHGNIWLDNNDQFPVLMGGWKYKNQDPDGYTDGYTDGPQIVDVLDPLTVVINN